MSILFEPTRIGNFEIKNRFIRSATYYALSDPDGFIGDASLDLMKNLAANDIGLIITGYAYVLKHGQSFPDMNGIDRDDHIIGFKRMTKAVHDLDGKIVMQIAHCGSASETAAAGEGKFLSVSPVQKWPDGARKPTEMTEADIEEIIDAFGHAARRVQEAGFDGVQIHGAHGYLGTQFLSPATNQRTDKWGGSLENRTRFLVEVTRAMKKRVDEDFPIMIKLGCRDYTAGDNGLTIEDGAEAAKILENEGICHIEVSHGVVDKTYRKQLSDITSSEKEAFLVPDGKVVREKTTVPLSLVAGMRSLPVMEGIVKSGISDHISICRPFIREPDLVKNWKNGSDKSADCISCRGCFNIDEAGNKAVYCRQLEILAKKQ